jgi:putative Ca2+/H+ antiporter (TMEM165/GDT1 family)
MNKKFVIRRLLAKRFLTFTTCVCVLGALFYLTIFSFVGGYFYFANQGMNVFSAMLNSAFLGVGSFAMMMFVIDKWIDVKEKESKKVVEED